jgi:hypothetical protein
MTPPFLHRHRRSAQVALQQSLILCDDRHSLTKPEVSGKESACVWYLVACLLNVTMRDTMHRFLFWAIFGLNTGDHFTLRRIRLLFPRHTPLPEPVRKAIVYLWHNRRRMDYAAFRQAGLLIGSGTVESAAKTLV